MKTLIVARHGEYDYIFERLNIYGREEVTKLSLLLAPLIEGQKVKIFASAATRTRESAKILSTHFGVDFEIHSSLSLESNECLLLADLLEFVRSQLEKVDVLVLVTHLEMVESFPSFFARNELGVEVRSRFVETGAAWVLDLENGLLSLVNSPC